MVYTKYPPHPTNQGVPAATRPPVSMGQSHRPRADHHFLTTQPSTATAPGPHLHLHPTTHPCTSMFNHKDLTCTADARCGSTYAGIGRVHAKRVMWQRAALRKVEQA